MSVPQLVWAGISESPCPDFGAVAAPPPAPSTSASLDAWPANPEAFPPESYTDRDLERAAVGASAQAFQAMVQPGLLVASECGNMYAGAPGPIDGAFVLGKNTNVTNS